MSAYYIRTAAEGAEELLAGLIRRAFRDVAERFDLTPSNCPSHPSNCTADWIRTAFQKGVTYAILEIEGVASGCVAVEITPAGVCYLERLAVLPACRGRGYGTLLVRHGLAMARERGVREIGIGIIAADEHLQAWYVRQGFVTGKRASYPHLPFEVLFMSRPL